MDLEWLLPQQIDQILKFCELSSVQDLTIAANILQTHQWDLEVRIKIVQKAMHDVVEQNDQMTKKEQQQELKKNSIVYNQYENLVHNPNDLEDEQEKFELDSHNYGQLMAQSQPIQQNNLNSEATLLAQQNFEYEQMQRIMLENQEKQAQLEAYRKLKEEQFAEGKKNFEQRTIEGDSLTIKFRLPNQTSQFTFSQKDKVETVFKYVNCCLRDGFENRYSDFDLTQAYPQLSLSDKKNLTLGEVFEGSTGELLMLKEC